MPERSRRARIVVLLYVFATCIALTVINYAVSTHLVVLLMLPAALSYAALAAVLFAYQRRGSQHG